MGPIVLMNKAFRLQNIRCKIRRMSRRILITKKILEKNFFKVPYLSQYRDSKVLSKTLNKNIEQGAIPLLQCVDDLPQSIFLQRFLYVRY